MPKTQATPLPKPQELQTLDVTFKALKLGDCLTIKLSLKNIARSNSDNEAARAADFMKRHEREDVLNHNKGFNEEYKSFPLTEAIEPACPPLHPLPSSLSVLPNASQLSQIFGSPVQTASKILSSDSLSPLSGSGGFYNNVLLNGLSPFYTSDMEASETYNADL